MIRGPGKTLSGQRLIEFTPGSINEIVNLYLKGVVAFKLGGKKPRTAALESKKTMNEQAISKTVKIEDVKQTKEERIQEQKK